MKKALVIDDGPDSLLVCRTILEAAGYRVVEAIDDRRALESLRRERPHLVFLDVMMRGTLESADLSQEIQARANLSGVPVIMISSITPNEYAIAFSNGERILVDAWISKPIQPDVLLQTIRQYHDPTLQKFADPKSGENVWLWLSKIVTGVLIIVVLLIHFIVNHALVSGGLLTYADVVAYYRNPVIPIMEIAFLALVVAHSLIGLRGIILDLHPSRAVLTAINWLFTIVGVGAIIYGIWLVQVIASKGAQSK